MSKICMLVTNSVRKDPRVRKEAMSALAAGHDVTVIGIKDQNYEKSFVENAPYRIILIDPIINSHKRFSPAWFIKGIMKANRYNNEFIKHVVLINPDIIHSNDYDTLLAGYKSSKRCNSKLVYDSHEIATGSILAEKYRIVKWYIKKREGRIIKKAYAVISVSNAAADYLKSLYHIDRPFVITNCPQYHAINNDKLNDSFEVLYQGIMSNGRGYEEFIKSAKYTHEGIKFIVRGYGETKNELIELANSEGVSDHVYFPDPVEINELVTVAANSSVGVVLTKNVCVNYNMTVSNKLFEYLQAGLPVILSNVKEHVYLNEKYNIGIVINEVTPETIAEAINKLYSDKSLYNTLKSNVIKSRQLLSWESFEKKLLDIYRLDV